MMIKLLAIMCLFLSLNGGVVIGSRLVSIWNGEGRHGDLLANLMLPGTMETSKSYP